MYKDIRIVPAIYPMPVVLIATYNEDGSIDVMNAAWVTAHDFTQIKLNLADEHQTTKNILRNKAFSIALADSKHVEAADYVGLVSGAKEKDKFLKSGLKAEKGKVVNAPVLLDFPIVMECVPVEDIQEDYGVVGEIKRLAVKEEALNEKGQVDVSKLDIIAYDPFTHGYIKMGEKVGQAFFEGRKLM